MPKALVIDDNELNRETLELLLRRENLDTISLSSPSQLQKYLPDMDEVVVVFLDLEFPNYDGMKLIDEIRAIPILSGIPIIAYTVHISEQDNIRNAGFDGFLGKPLKVNRFPEYLRRILNGETVWDAGQ